MHASAAVAQSPPIALLLHHSLETVPAVEDRPRSGFYGDSDQGEVRLSAARGESESFQVTVINPAKQPLRDVRLAVTGFKDIAATILEAAPIHLDKPGRSGGVRQGHYLDLLRPPGEVSIAPDAFAVFWIDLKVQPGAAPGTQDGKLTVTTSAGSRSASIKLKVRSFELPVTPSLKLAFANTPSWMTAYYGHPLSPQQSRAVMQTMLDHRLGPVPMWDGASQLFSDENLLKECFAGGMNVILLTAGGNTDVEITRSLDALEPRIALLKKLGALDRAYFFGYDEVLVNSPEKIPAMRKAYALFHQRHPEIKRINTSRPDPRINDVVDIFVVPTAVFTKSMAKDREAWWYSVGDDNLSNEPDFRLDFPAMAHRAFFWADWQVGVKGHLYWAVQREWPGNKDVADKNHPENGWKLGYVNAFTKGWTLANGGGNLFYPDPAGGMWASVRAKRVRDGIEDYEYLAQLKKVTDEIERRKVAGTQRFVQGIREGLLRVPTNIVNMTGGWREGWSIESRDEAACSVTTHPNAIHGGQQALRVVPSAQGIHITQDTSVVAKEAGILSGWIKTDDLAGEARLTAEYRDVDGHTLLSLKSDPVTGSSRKFVEAKLALPPAPAKSLILRIGLWAQSTGAAPKDVVQKAFFDDLSLTLAGGQVPLTNGDFEARPFELKRDFSALVERREHIGRMLEKCQEVLRGIPINDHRLYER